MEYNEENTAYLIGKVQELSFLQNPPPHYQAAIGWVKGVLKFVEDQEKLDWLLEQVRDNCVFFPRPAELREIYSRRWKPADDKTVDAEFAGLGKSEPAETATP